MLRAAAEGDGAETAEAEANLGEQLIHQLQDDLRMTTLEPLRTLEQLPLEPQCRRAVLGRSVDGEDSHGAAAARLAGARGAWRARKRRASATSWVTVIGGSAARNTRPYARPNIRGSQIAITP